MDREKQEIAGTLPYLFPLTKGNMRRKRRKTLEKEIGSPDLEIGNPDFAREGFMKPQKYDILLRKTNLKKRGMN